MSFTFHPVHYLFLHNDHSFNYRKNKRTFHKRKVNVSSKSYKGDLENNAPTLLSNHLKSKSGSGSIKGVLVDTNVLTSAHPCYLPTFPSEWDILCLECDIKSYKCDTVSDTTHWSKVEINDTKHFLINPRSEKKVEAIFTKSKSLDTFSEAVNNLNIYAINNGFYSNGQQLEDKSVLKLNVQTIDEHKLPKVTLVCVHVNESLLFHTILTFMKLDYPKDLLELVIVTNRKISGNLPDDNRIKVINVKSKVEFGYMLNQGIQCASYEHVCHFFEGCYYYTSYVRTMVEVALSHSGQHCVISADTSLYDPEKKVSSLYNEKCFTNMMYKKQFWSTRMFVNSGNVYNDLLAKFIECRTSCCVLYPSVKLSFLTYKEQEDSKNIRKIPLSLYNFLDKGLQESFDMCTQSA